MMRLDANVVEPDFVQSLQTRQTESVPVSRLSHLRQSRESNHSVRNHPREVGSTFRLPPVESVTGNPGEVLIRNDKIPDMRETTSTRMSSDVSSKVPSTFFNQSPKVPFSSFNQPSGSADSGRGSSVESSVSAEMSPAEDVHNTLIREGSDGGNQLICDPAESASESPSQCLSSPGPSHSREVAAVPDRNDRESLGFEISYVSSSSSTDNTPMRRSMEVTAVKDEAMQKRRNRKPPIPPKSKHELALADTEAAFSDMKTKNGLHSNASQHRHQEASLAKHSLEERARRAPFADDENTSLASDLKFTYSPLSSASFVTSDDQRSPYKDHPTSTTCSSIAATSTTIQPSSSNHASVSDDCNALEPENVTSEGDSHQPHDNEEVQLKSSMTTGHEDQIHITADKYAAPDDLASPSTRRAKNGDDSERVTEDIEAVLAEYQSIGSAKGGGAISTATANEYLSFTSSLSSKPSSEFNPEDDREGGERTASFKAWDNEHLASNELSFEANSDTFDNSEASRDLHNLVPSGPGGRKRLLADNENVFVGLYNDIVYLLVHGNKKQDDDEPADPRGYNDQVSQQDSCASDDRSGALNPEGDQVQKDYIPPMCFICGRVSTSRSQEETTHIKSVESNISAKSIQCGPTVEARDAFIENANSSNENSRESCPRETIDEHMIPSDFIPDEAIFDKADSEESEESCDFVISDKRTEGIPLSAEVATTEYVQGVDEVKGSVLHHMESSEFVCWHSSADPHPYDDQPRPSESLFLKATKRLEHQPIMPPHLSAFHSKTGQDYSTPVCRILKSDDDEILQAVISIQERVERTQSRSLAPDLARGFRHNINEDVPNIDQYVDSLENQWICLQKVKDMLFADLKPPVSTCTVHVQPVQELGESRNMHIELPVSNIPRSVLPQEAFDWKKELDILKAIVKEDFCDKTSNSDYCLETTLSRDISIRSIKSNGEVNAGYSVKPASTAAFESQSFNQSPSEVNDESEFFQISNQGTHDDRSTFIAWFNSIQKVGWSNERIDSEFENYLNQPARNADLDWQSIPVPEIEGQLQRLEATFVQTVKTPPNETRSKCAGDRPVLQLKPTALTDKVAKGIERRSGNTNLPPQVEENDQSHLFSIPGDSIKEVVSSQFSRRDVALNSESVERAVRTAEETATRYSDPNKPLENGMDKDDLKSLNCDDGIENTGANSSLDLIDLNTPESVVIESQIDEESPEMIDSKASGIAGNNEDVDKKNSMHDDDIGRTVEVSSMDLIDLHTPENSAVEEVTDHESNEKAAFETPETFSHNTTIAGTSA
ncbi:hypothetical protein MHU86_590 [Fragilaria crotonensis]|nr:hypothetical protein MHU86_590 [Fragilaria crotonensis]